MDDFMLALCAWRENRHGQSEGMQSVINSVMNRVKLRHTSPYIEVTRRLQYSSITAPRDPQLNLYPGVQDPTWKLAQSLAAQAIAGTLPDITGGATNYYAFSIDPPDWAVDMKKTVVIAGQQFFV